MLHQELLSLIWSLSDVEQDGTLSLPEFAVAMHLVSAAVAGVPVPPVLPDSLIRSVLEVETLHLHITHISSVNKASPLPLPPL